MDDQLGLPRRYRLSPAAQRRSEEQWKARLSVIFLAMVTLLWAAVSFHIVHPH